MNNGEKTSEHALGQLCAIPIIMSCLLFAFFFHQCKVQTRYYELRSLHSQPTTKIKTAWIMQTDSRMKRKKSRRFKTKPRKHRLIGRENVSWKIVI